MASIVSVDTLQGLTSGQVTLPAGHKIKGTDVGSIVAPGSVVQVVSNVKFDTFSGAAGGTPIAVSGINCTITPKFSTSKILILAQIMYASVGTTYGGFFRRNGIDIGLGNAGSGQQQVSMGMALVTDSNQSNTFPYMFIDSPASTSLLTYQFYVNNDNGTAIYINRSVSDGAAAVGKRGISTVTLMEIAQ
jgi:hypothetical protein